MAGGFALISGEFSAGQVGKGRNHYTYISLRLLINSTHFWYGISATLSLIPDDTYRVNYLSARYQVIRRRKLDHAWECGAGGRKDWPETLFSACDSPIFFPSPFWYPPSSSSSSQEMGSKLVRRWKFFSSCIFLEEIRYNFSINEKLVNLLILRYPYLKVWLNIVKI